MMRVLDMLRITLGVIMAVTSLAWFLPALLPFVRTAMWVDPMSLRLMGQLEASGLLAVAKFVQLTGGLALLLNRAVPFALAAMVAVNLCGAFVAVLIEGAPGLALMALGVLALNALLMFAYLPAYAGVLASGALADGEGAAPGDHYNSLFVNPLGGASRKQCLVALVPLAGALLFYWKVVPGLNALTGLVVLVLPVLAWVVNLVRAKS
ncbi:MAG: hypothetical protein KDE15_06865 [Erythrobacter sp.]|nr:hypothetical protein [Erythrobacter sp.]